jgi:hypothetical protein
MKTTTHKVDLPYEKEELLALFDLASKEDVDEGGRYDRRGGAINIWSHPVRRIGDAEKCSLRLPGL